MVPVDQSSAALAAQRFVTEMNKPSRPGGSWVVQGCLFGAVALFVGLLLVMIVLAYLRFRERPTTSPVPQQEVGHLHPAWFGPTTADRAPNLESLLFYDAVQIRFGHG